MIERFIAWCRQGWRQRRMQRFYQVMRPAPGSHILDLGGTLDLWSNAPQDLHVTLFNRKAEIAEGTGGSGKACRHIDIVEGDICRDLPASGGYDIAFSNSVLEHVGSCLRQKQFSEAITRVAPAFWIQVPAPIFPIEVHCRVPFWWMMPSSLRRRWITRWRRQSLFHLSRQMAGTRPISRRRLRTLFPDATIATEWCLGIPKSYYVYRAREEL